MNFIRKSKTGIGKLNRWKSREKSKLDRFYKMNKSDLAWSHLPSSPSKNQKNSDFSKSELKDCLLIEQGYLCCYCQRLIGNTINDHDVEHLYPKSLNPRRYTFDYCNICISCRTNSPLRLPRHNPTCNEARGRKVLPLLPTRKRIESNFKFAKDGKIYGFNKDADSTIEILNLNHDALVKARKSALDAILHDDIYSHVMLNDSELNRIKNRYSKKKNNKFIEFRQAILFNINFLLKK